MLCLAVRYDVHTLVEEDHIVCACPAVYYLLGHRAHRVTPRRSVDEVVSSLTIEAIHSSLCKAAVDRVGPATAMYIVVACVGVGVGGCIESTTPEGGVVPSIPVDVV